MESLLTYAISVFMAFFAIMNPIANTPVFLGLVQGESAQSKRSVAKTACLVAFMIVMLFVLLGKYIFEFFGITIPAFKITGGILIFYVGFEMLMSKQSQIQHNNMTQSPRNLAVSPLGIPILAGPGTIVTAMNFSTQADWVHLLIIGVTFGLMVLLNYITLVLGDATIRLVGKNLIAVIGKLMGLILAIIGTGMIIEGIELVIRSYQS